MTLPLHAHWLSLKFMKFIFPPEYRQALLSSISIEHIYECEYGKQHVFQITDKGSNEFVVKQTQEMPCFTPWCWKQKLIPRDLKINHGLEIDSNRTSCL